MFIVTQNDNADARLAALEQQVAELRAEIAALKPAAKDRKEYMKNYMAKRRAKERTNGVNHEQ
jgi:hypothetical protein